MSAAFDQIKVEDSPLYSEFAAKWDGAMADFGVTGYSVVAIKDGKVVLLDARGKRDPFADKPATVDTMYYIASVTKTMTGLAISKLAEEGKVDLKAPVQRYLPRFTLKDSEYAKTITIEDLLCHRPGIDGGDIVLLDAYTGGITDDRFFRLLAMGVPKKEVTYSNVHFTILGRVIEAVTGRQWQDYLNDAIFTPAGMDRTTAYASKLYGDANCAIPTIEYAGRLEPVVALKTDSTMHAAGGVGTTPRDVARYLSLMLTKGDPEAGRVVSASVVESMLTRHSDYKPVGSIRKRSGFGYAWNLGQYRDTPGYADHGGGYAGCSAYLAMVPEKGVAAAFLVNAGEVGSGLMDVIMVDLCDRLLGYPRDDSLLEGYRKQASTRRPQLAKNKPIAPNPAVGATSLAPAMYAGRYSNELYGDIDIAYSGGMLRMDYGDLPQALRAVGKDEFTAHSDDRDPGTPGKFIVSGGKVVALELELNAGFVRFTR